MKTVFKKICVITLTAVMLLTTSVTAFAAAEDNEVQITAVNITVEAPECGTEVKVIQIPGTGAAVPSLLPAASVAGDAGYVVSSDTDSEGTVWPATRWVKTAERDSNSFIGKFEGDNTYAVMIRLAPASGYFFDSEIVNDNIKINGEAAADHMLMDGLLFVYGNVTARHKLTRIEAKESTVTAEGNTEYWTCSGCGKYFNDAEGNTEIAEGSWVTPKKSVSDAAKEALEEEISKMKELPKGDYTDESFQSLQDALAEAEALLKDKNTTPVDFTKAIDNIEKAKNSLKDKKAEEKAAAEAKAELNKTVEDAKKIEKGNYTDESYKALQDAIAEAEKVAADPKATVAQLKAAQDKVTAAKSGLKVKEPEIVKAGDAIKYNNNTYKVTSVKNKTVAFTKARNAKSVTVPATIKLADGNTYKVTAVNASAFKAAKIRTVTIGKNVKTIKKNAFKSSKATKVILKTKLLKKASVKGSLKGSKIKTVNVSVGKKSVNKKYVKSYKKIFTKTNAGKKVTVK